MKEEKVITRTGNGKRVEEFKEYVYKYKNECLFVCLFVSDELLHRSTDRDETWHV